ncbi:MAG: SIMPL domain-containing protein [Patescibacteria group bacterium]
MSERTKNFLGWAIIIAVLAIGFSSISYVRSFSKTIRPDSFRSFSVSGEGKAVGIPDIAEFSFTVLTEGGKDIATLRKANDEKSNKAIEFLKKEGVAKEDIKTASYNLSPRYQNSNCGYSVTAGREVCPPPEIVGYSISNTVEVKMRKEMFDKIGTVLSGVVTAGANTVSQLNFTTDDPTEVENTARALAINKAEAKAKAIAKAGGFSVGRLLDISEGGIVPYYQESLYDSKAMSAMGGGVVASPAPTIEPGSRDVVVNVTLRYEID